MNGAEQFLFFFFFGVDLMSGIISLIASFAPLGIPFVFNHL